MIVGLVAMTSRASAQSIEFAGTTAGCFYTTTVCNPTGGDQVMYLKYVTGQFDQYTSNPGGIAVLGSGGLTGSNLGYFQLGRTSDVYTGEQFLLKIMFSSPLLTGPNAVYTAAVVGTVTNAGVTGGGVNIQFGPAQTFAFDGPNYTGSFTMKVGDVSVSPGTLESGGGVPVAAFITTNITGVTATPEPGTTALLATGLIGLVPLARRRRRS
jgi:hypothetical protein